jgi:hypothetical protein
LESLRWPVPRYATGGRKQTAPLAPDACVSAKHSARALHTRRWLNDVGGIQK